MEKALQKIARQILAYDEASLVSLWEKYARIVAEFEPTRRWEEAVMVFGLIQAMRFKNQLFNHHWKDWSRPGERGEKGEAGPGLSREYRPPDSDGGPGDVEDKRGKLLRFRPREDEEPV